MKKSVEEIIAIIKENNISVKDFAYGDFNLIDVGEWNEVSQVGGEGKGDYWHSVKYFKDHDVYIKTVGFHQSYNGTEFYDGYGKQVFPTQKTVTVYENI